MTYLFNTILTKTNLDKINIDIRAERSEEMIALKLKKVSENSCMHQNKHTNQRAEIFR